MLEFHVGEFLRHRVGGVHVAERGREDDVAAGAGETLERPLGVGAFRHAFEVGEFDLFFAAQRLLGFESALMVLIRPSKVADRPDIDEAGLDLGFGRHRPEGERGRGGCECEKSSFHWSSSS